MYLFALKLAPTAMQSMPTSNDQLRPLYCALSRDLPVILLAA